MTATTHSPAPAANRLPVVLPLDHPGAGDPRYRARREALCAVAETAACGEMPAIDYLEENAGLARRGSPRLARDTRATRPPPISRP